MKRSAIIILVGLLVLIGIWLALQKSPPAVVPASSPENRIVTNSLPIANTNRLSPGGTSELPAWARPPGISESGWAYALRLREMFLRANHPLDFHARVVDQNNTPVVGAKIEFRVVRVDEQTVASQKFLHMKEGSEQVEESKVLASDENGWIHFTGVSGKRLTALSLSKAGYISSYPNPAYVGVSYDYGGERQPVGDILATNGWDPNAGYYFHLWKRGDAVKLIKVSSSVPVVAYKTNWYAVNLITGKANDLDDADLKFWFETTNDKDGNPTRQFRFQVVNGGLLPDTMPYPYQAPQNGYNFEWDWYYEPYGKDAGEDKSALMIKKFYVNLRNGKVFGAITWHWSSENGVEITGYLNSTGSRNLEPDPAKLITDPEEIRRLDEATRVK